MMVFALCIFVFAVLLFLPGTLFNRLLNIDLVDALCLAPVSSIVLYSIGELLCAGIGLPCSTLFLFIFALLSSAVAFGFRFLIVRSASETCRLEGSGTFKIDVRRQWPVVLYLLIGFVAVYLFFIKQLDGPDSFFQGWDNTYHLSAIRGFLESGNWSPVLSGRYYSGEITPYNSSQVGYYPSVLHSLCAMVASILSVEPMVALNAVNAAVIAIVFPLGMNRLLAKMSRDGSYVVVMGSLLCLGTAVSPWDLLTYGPLFPNLLSMSLVPATMSIFLDLCESISDRDFFAVCKWSLLILISALAVFLAHPNGIFTLIVVLWPFLASWLWNEVGQSGRFRGRAIFAEISLVVITVAFWLICYNHPAFAGAVAINWPAISDLKGSIVDGFFFSMVGRPKNLVASFFLFVGLFSLLKDVDNRWIVVSFILGLGLYAVSAGTDGPAKHLLTGFWYTDYHRLAVVSAFVSSIVASFGAGKILSVISNRLTIGRNGIALNGIMAAGTMAAFILYLSIGFLLYKGDTRLFDEKVISSPFSYQAREISNQYNKDLVYYDVLTNEELQFVKSVSNYLNDGSLVLNSPLDGTLLLFAVNSTPVYYRGAYTPVEDEETLDSRLIRTRLFDFAHSDEVRAAVERTGAKYVLQLDHGERDDEIRINYVAHNPEEWVGIESIEPDTPGFTLLKEQSDMRLYRIDL